MRKIFFTIILATVLLVPLSVSALTINDAGTKLSQIGGKTGLTPNLESTTGLVINTILALIGTVFFILTVYAGIRWMTAQGNDEKVTKAKDTLEAALIGITIVFLAYAITAFVTNRWVGGGGGGGKCVLPDADGVEECIDTVVGGISKADCANGDGVWRAGESCPE